MIEAMIDIGVGLLVLLLVALFLGACWSIPGLGYVLGALAMAWALGGFIRAGWF